MTYEPTLEHARRRDEADPLNGYRQRFAHPRDANKIPTLFLCGHSLGLMPLEARSLVNEDLDDWSRLAVLYTAVARAVTRGRADGGHPVVVASGDCLTALGTVAGITAITLDDVKAFAQQMFTRANLTIGVSGDASDDLIRDLQDRLRAGLPGGAAAARPSIDPPRLGANHVDIVEKETRATAISCTCTAPRSAGCSARWPTASRCASRSRCSTDWCSRGRPFTTR